MSIYLTNKSVVLVTKLSYITFSRYYLKSTIEKHKPELQWDLLSSQDLEDLENSIKLLRLTQGLSPYKTLRKLRRRK